MESYRIEWRKSVKKDLRRISPDDVRKIVEAVGRLALEPRPPKSRKLSGSKHAYRIRVGDYRVLYEIHDRRVVVEVIRVGHRRNVYR